MVRSPAALDAAIEAHKAHFAVEPSVILIRDTYHAANRFYFQGRLYTLCCGRGALYSGIPAIVTPSAMVEDFLLGY